jgi:hypothetical protein
VKRSILIVAAALALLAPASASADTKRCPNGYRATDVRAHDLPAKTDGYASPCLVASVAHGVVTYRLEHRPYRWPRTIRVHGARWTAGKWRVRHRTVTDDGSTFERVSARRIGRDDRVTWRFVS